MSLHKSTNVLFISPLHPARPCILAVMLTARDRPDKPPQTRANTAMQAMLGNSA
jgi:hypothetical protein